MCAWAAFTSYAVMMVISYQLGKTLSINYNLRSIFVLQLLALRCFLWDIPLFLMQEWKTHV
jgi:hypothetical protein